MAREARHMLLSVAEVQVDLTSHRDHPAGRFFIFLVITGEIAFYMAACTLAAHRNIERGHHWPDIFRLQQL